MTYKDKASYDSTPACRVHEILSECACDSELTWHSQQMWMRFTANIHAKPSLRDIHGKCGCDSERLYKRFWAYVTVRATVYEIQSDAYAIYSKCTWESQWTCMRFKANAYEVQSLGEIWRERRAELSRIWVAMEKAVVCVTSFYKTNTGNLWPLVFP